MVSVHVDAAAFKRLLRERCMTGEQLRRRLKLSPATLAKLFSGGVVRDDVFHRVVFELERHPVKPIAQELAEPSLPPERAGEVVSR